MKTSKEILDYSKKVIKQYTALSAALLLVLNLSTSCWNSTSEATKKSKKHDNAVNRLEKAKKNLDEEIKEYYEAVQELNEATQEESRTKQDLKNEANKL